MIAQLCDENRQDFLRAVHGCDALAPEMLTDLSVFGAQSALMRFFAADSTGALELKGAGARLCGTYDAQEAGIFLKLMGVESVFVHGALPQGYHAEEPLFYMVYDAHRAAEPETGLLFETDREPAAAKITDFFCDRKNDPDAWDNFYSELCTKRTHGAAEVWAAVSRGEIIATAGAYALGAQHAFLSGIETKEPFRGQGVGGKLTALLAEKLSGQGRTVTLLCRKERLGFYERLGFIRSGTVLYAVQDDAGKAPAANKE